MASSEPIDWSLCTPEGQEREQLRRWIALPLRARLEALEEMCDHARATLASLRRRGLPWIDPETGEAVLGEPSAKGRRDPAGRNADGIPRLRLDYFEPRALSTTCA